MSGKVVFDGCGIPAKCKIYANGETVAFVMPHEKKTLEINGDTEICGRVSINPKGASIIVRDNKVTLVHIEWDKKWGKAILIVDAELDLENYVEDEQQGEKPIYDLLGARGRYIKVYEDRCVLGTRAGFSSLLTGNATDGEKTIYYSDVLGVQFKASGVTIGYIQLETASVTMNNKSDNFFNENSFTFEAALEQKAREVLEFIQKKVAETKKASNTMSTPVYATSPADELKKFKELLDCGIITQEEFDAKKKQLLGL